MNVFHKVTLQSLKRNPSRTIVTIIGIVLSTAMICAVTTFASSFINYALETAIYSDGNWHGSELDTDRQTYQTLKNDSAVEEMIYLQQLGYALADGCENEFKPYIYLLGAGENVESVLPVHITDGRYPRSTTEILLPNHLYTNGGIRYHLGDTVTLALGERLLDGYRLSQNSPCYYYINGEEVRAEETIDVRETRTYTVVGFYDRFNYRIEDYSAPGYTALTLADPAPSSHLRYDIYFRMKNPDDIYDFMEDHHLTGLLNTDVLMYAGTSRFDSFHATLYSLAAIVIALIMFGSISLIYNAFSISVAERTKQFGLLSSVGATKKQLRRMVLFEALTVSAIGIPLGIVAGIGGIGVTLLFIGDKFRSMGFPLDLKLSVSFASVVAAIIVALLTVLISALIPAKRATRITAMEAIRQNRDVTVKGKRLKTAKLTYRLFGLPGVLASKHYKRSKKKYRATVLSLFMSIVLFVSASSFTDYLMESVTGGLGGESYDLTFYASDDRWNETSPDALLEKTLAADSVTDAVYVRQQWMNIAIDPRFLTEEGLSAVGDVVPDDNNRIGTYAYVSFIDDGAFDALLKKYHLDETKFKNPAAPLAIAFDGNTSFNYDSQRYETIHFLQSDSTAVEAEHTRHIDGYRLYGETPNENGDIVIRYIKLDKDGNETDTYLDIPLEEANVTTILHTGKVIFERPFYCHSVGSFNLLYPESLADVVFETADVVNDDYHFYILSDDHIKSNTALSSLLIDNGLDGKSLFDVAAEQESQRNIITIIRVFSYGFVILLSLIAAANVFNTITTNIDLRRREFAMLQSVGMTQRGFRKMMYYECLLYGSKALLLGLPVSAAVSYLIYRAISDSFETTFRLPLDAVGIAVLSVFAVVLSAMMYSMRKIKKTDPIDALKNENL